MATSDEKQGQKSIAAHEEAPRLQAPEAEPQYEQTDPMVDTDNVPPVTADVEETPKTIRYGAAILLGLAFGVTCYLLGASEIRDGKDTPKHPVATEEYFSQGGTYGDPDIKGPLPDPFLSPFEPVLVGEYYTGDVAVDENFPGEGTSTDASSALAATPTDAAVVTTPSGTVIYLFEFDSTGVPENKELTAIAEHATANGMCLDVRAYTDEKGRPAYNQKLSERRAKAIGDYLVAHGVPAKNISIHGMGPTHAYGDDFQDRRAEVIEIAR